MSSYDYIQFLIRKYQKQIENLWWHIDTNKPVQHEVEKCKQRISDLNDVINDLKVLTK